ncbi:MAG: ABC transporter ATP-binding protein [Lachnospiraceae bacterium]|nr:ABC transporter ATP-binding protein [Candidatus Merdinaster equi]
MVQVENLKKQFRSGKDVKVVVNTSNWVAKDGSITGFIGHNGAGKTTTMKMITGVMRPTEGRCLLNGIDIKENPIEAKKQFGYVSDSPDHFLRLRGIEYLNFIADIYDVDTKKRMDFINEYAERFGMTSALNQTILSYSHGMRQKMMIMGALIHDPSIWLLDEPLTGLDPEAAFELKKMMREHADRGNSVLFSTHVLEVAEKLCDEIVLIKKGNIMFNGTLAQLQSQYPQDMSLEEIFLDINKEESNE